MSIIYSKIVAGAVKLLKQPRVQQGIILQHYYLECLPEEKILIRSFGHCGHEVSLTDGDSLNPLYTDPRSSSGISFTISGRNIRILNLNVFVEKRGKGLGTRLLMPLLRYYRENQLEKIILNPAGSALGFWLKEAERNPDIKFSHRVF
jgi:hypothetical protein